MIITKEEIMLTTVDNPFNPFENFDEWFAFDCRKNYFTCSYIDRIVQANNPNQSSLSVSDVEFDKAMKEIVFYNPTLYKLVRRNVEIDDIYLMD